MSSQLKEEKINENDYGNIYSQERHPDGFNKDSKVNLNDLVNRLKSEKKKILVSINTLKMWQT